MALMRFVRSVVAAAYVEVAVERDVAVVADVMEEQVVSVAADAAAEEAAVVVVIDVVRR